MTPRRFGVEIEVSRQLTCVNYHDRSYSNAWTEIERALAKAASNGLISNKWRIKVDISCGGEVVSPPIVAHDGLRQTAVVCNEIRKIAKAHNKPAVDGECGLHIHVDAGGMTAKQLGRLFSLVHIAEPIIYSMYPSRNFQYCAPIDVNMRQASRFRDWTDVRDVWYRGSNNVRQKDKVYREDYINSTSQGEHYDGTRYHGFNIHCYWKLNTVEFRYGSGTIDPIHIKAYYEMCLAMVNTAMSGVKIDIPDSIKGYKYHQLVSYYSSNYRFRKFVRKIAKTCNFSKSTIKLILELVRANNPMLLKKEPVYKELFVIDETNCKTFVYRVLNNIYNFEGRKVSEIASREIIECTARRIRRNRNRIIAANANISIEYPIHIRDTNIRDQLEAQGFIATNETVPDDAVPDDAVPMINFNTFLIQPTENVPVYIEDVQLEPPQLDVAGFNQALEGPFTDTEGGE